MALKKIMTAAFVVAATLAFVRSGRAEESPCALKITRANVVRCALLVSPVVRAEKQGTEAVEGRRLTASAFLPANPVISFSAARRSAPGGTPEAFNWNASLTQEIEIGGQRGARKEVAQSQLLAQEQRVLVSRQDVAASTWSEFFEVIATQEDLRLTAKLVGVANAIATVARARADQGLSSAVEADLAEATSLRLVQARFAGERRLAQSQARLANLVGSDPSTPPRVEGDLQPLPNVEAAAHRVLRDGFASRPEILVAEGEQRAFVNRADLYRRLRIPNPGISVFVQNDGFNERVLGLGLSLPIPLPGSVGRSYIGEIAEAEALSRRASTEVERLQRQLRLDVVTVLRDFESRRLEVDALPPDRLQRAEDGLQALGREIQAGRLNVRDALVTQQALVELLRMHLAARHALAVASVELARVSGMPLEGGAT